MIDILQSHSLHHEWVFATGLSQPNKGRDTAAVATQLEVCLLVGQLWLTICCISSTIVFTNQPQEKHVILLTPDNHWTYSQEIVTR